MKAHTALVLTIVLAFGSGAVVALPPETNGESVRSIPNADGIRGWSHLDNQRVLLNLDEKHTYLLTLKHQCHGLTWAQNVTVTMSNNTIWAGFDAIEADRPAPSTASTRSTPKDSSNRATDTCCTGPRGA
jgi:hypothetical protein